MKGTWDKITAFYWFSKQLIIVWIFYTEGYCYSNSVFLKLKINEQPIILLWLKDWRLFKSKNVCGPRGKGFFAFGPILWSFLQRNMIKKSAHHKIKQYWYKKRHHLSKKLSTRRCVGPNNRRAFYLDQTTSPSLNPFNWHFLSAKFYWK